MSDSHTSAVRLLDAGDAASYRALRLRGLRDHPTAFGAAYQDEEGQTVEQTASRLAAKNDEDFILGAFVGAELGGLISLVRREGAKRRHRATISGMYVAPEYRTLGLGRALIDEAVRRARLMDGLEFILLGVAVSNDPARHLYESVGFEPHYIDRRALKIDGAYVDLEWMRLALT